MTAITALRGGPGRETIAAQHEAAPSDKIRSLHEQAPRLQFAKNRPPGFHSFI
jgi:hypothetical protein